VTSRRGRPPKSEEPAARERLLDAAAAACVDEGFDAVTLAGIAARAEVTPAAVYNHFADKAELLYTAGRVAIGRLGASTVPRDDATQGAHDVVAAFLHPSFRASRRLILELHLAGRRHPELAVHLADWHREFAGLAVARSPGQDEAPDATVKALFLLLLGLCHVEDLESVDADPVALGARVDRMVDALYRP
jgi:AcrR family transcriptional regulator